MSERVKVVNRFFKTAVKSEVDELLGKIVFTERQELIFSMYFIKKKDANFIADTLGYSGSVIYHEINTIREKLIKVL